MSVAKFTTAGVQPMSNGEAKGGSNTLVILLVLGAVAYLGYRFVIKPELDKRKQEEATKQ